MKRNIHLYDAFDSELCVIGAANDVALAIEVNRVIHFLEHAPDALLEDVAYTCARNARNMPSIIAVVATSVTDLRTRLLLAHRKLIDNAGRIRDKNGTYFFRERLCPQGRIAFLFPGAASFYPDMLRDLCLVFDDCRKAFDEMEEAIQDHDHVNFSPATYIFPPAACHRTDPSHLSAHGFAESCLAVHSVNTALARLFATLGIVPDGVTGFNGGDFAAMEVAGVYGNLDRDNRVLFMREAYQMLHQLVSQTDLPTCTMLSVMDVEREQIDLLLAQHPGRIAIAFFHSPRQLTLALAPDIVKPVINALHALDIKTALVPMDCPFNTPWCSKIMPPVKQFLSRWLNHAPTIELYSCATATRLPSQPRLLLNPTVDQWTSPILFEATIRQMHQDGFRIFIELGARGNMTIAIDEILKNQPHQVVAVNRIHRSGLNQLHHALGILAAQGVPLDLTRLHAQRRGMALNFDQPLSTSLRTQDELLLSARLPSLNVFTPSGEFLTASQTTSEQARKAMPVNSEKRRFDFGADLPMLANAEIREEQPGILLEIAKEVTLVDYPFLRDYALGTSQLSYTDPELKGLTLLSLMSGLEMMCEAARKLVPRRRVAQIDNLRSQRWISLERGSVKLIIRAERVAWSDPQYTAIRVQLRDDAPNSQFTWPIIEATILLTATSAVNHPIQPPPLAHPRPVNWSGHHIYPDRLFHGEGLRLVRHVDLWSEEGIDFEIEVPGRAEAVRYTRLPLFSIWPILLDGIVSSFGLWRSHERFADAISIPFRARRIIFHTAHFTEGARLRGYLRLISVTPRSHVVDIQISDGNGNLLIHIRGWEELCERVPQSYHNFILKPSEKYLTQELPLSLLGNPLSPVAASVATDIPFKLFESNQEIWLKTMACVLLSPTEREEWREMQGATNRRVEWLFGRAAAKEAVRRFLLKYHQARWTSADIPIWADDSGKPHPLGLWREHTAANIDLSIAHTSKLIVAAVVSNARIGIDIEMLGRDLTDDFTRGVFTPQELELAAHTGEAPTSILRFWCAKEALSKALGTGIRYSPKDMQITAINAITGQIEIELLGQWLEAFKKLRGRKNTIHSSIYAGHVFASSMLPASLFESE